MVKVSQAGSNGHEFQRRMIDASLNGGEGRVVVNGKDMTQECRQTARCCFDIFVCLVCLPFVAMAACCCCSCNKDRKVTKL
jgi:hypothetical protein